VSTDELDLAYMSIDTLKAQVHNLELENTELKRQLKSKSDRLADIDREADARLRSAQEDGYFRGIGGGPGY
jgi:cell division septum initiation protein DivIVA